jgi:hypothetical protein
MFQPSTRKSILFAVAVLLGATVLIAAGGIRSAGF